MQTMISDRDTLTVQEVRERLDRLSTADWIRLERASEYLSWGLSINGQDLLSEIFCRALEGKRKCPNDLPITIFLIGAMRSEVSSLLEKKDHDPLTSPMSASHEQEATASALDQITDLDTPLEILLAKETLQKFDDLFRNDENAQMVLMGKLDNLSAAEIQEVAGLSAVEYASLLRSIRRRYDKLTVKE